MTAGEHAVPTDVAADFDPFAGAALARVVPTTEPQREIWLAAKLEPAASLAYNESVAIRLDGALDVEHLRAALQRLVERHEALRSTVTPDGAELCVAETRRDRLSAARPVGPGRIRRAPSRSPRPSAAPSRRRSISNKVR